MMRYKKTLNGFCLLKDKNSIPSRVNGYMFSHSFENIFQAALNESQELATLWQNSAEKQEIRNQLIVEAVEYEIISSFLDQYRFAAPENMKFNFREHNSELISGNRFFELFTRSPEQRPLFKGEVLNKNQGYIRIQNEKYEILAEYHDFNYSLPVDYVIFFSDQGIVIDTPINKLQFKVSCCSGLVFPFPQDFGRFYLGFRKNAGQKITLTIRCRLKPRILLCLFFKRYRQFLSIFDGFLSFFEEWFSADVFFKKLKWNQIWAQSIIIENILQRKGDLKTIKLFVPI